MSDIVQTPGTLDEALLNCRRMLPDHPQMALAQAHAILKRDSANPSALRLAAAAHRALDEPQQAEQAELAAIHNSQSIPSLVAATRALENGRFGEASHLAAQHLQHTPDDLAALTLSAETAIALDVADKAEPLLRDVLRRAPGFLNARMLLIDALMRQDKLLEARARVDDLLAIRPDDETALRLVARIATDLGDHAATARTYEALLKHHDRSADLWVLYGDTLRFLGRTVDSILAYRRALALAPANGQAWWSLATLDPNAIVDQDIADMQTALASNTGKPEDAGNLHFALGAVLDARHNYPEAFQHFAEGNTLRRAAQPYDRDEITQQVDRSVAVLREVGVPPKSDGTRARPVPIFIIGMPRSGSTLVERILGSHSQIEGLGELAIMPHMVEALKRQAPDQPLEPRIAELSSDKLQQLATQYIDRAGEHRHTDRPFFIDKLHMNWRHLPVIVRMLPQAKIIDVRRNALDCCWSNYKLLFARGHPAAADLGDIGRFYVDYVRLIDGLEAIAPGRIYKVQYEDLVSDIEAETRGLLEHVGVNFEAQCVSFHLSDRPVATASAEQVRRPLNDSGIGAWRNYEQWLGPLKDALGPLANQ